MRFYETEQEFIELQEDEVCLESYVERKLNFWERNGSTTDFPEFSLSIVYWIARPMYKSEEHLINLVYKSFSFLPSKTSVDLSNRITLLDFLNKLKQASNTESLIEELILESFKDNPKNAINGTITNLAKLTQERDILKAKLEKVKMICND